LTVGFPAGVRFLLPVTGSEGFTTAEATGGEIIDVTGRPGGYNFLWAWVSGRKAERVLAAGQRQRL
jgi:hypothetical protein